MATWSRSRPGIGLTMLGIALLLLVSPALIGFLVLGMAAGVAFRLRFRASLRPAARNDRNDRSDRGRRIRRR